MLKNKILIALRLLYELPTDSPIDTIKKCYKTKKTPNLELCELFNVLESPYSSQKALNLALNKVIYPIETKCYKGEEIPCDLAYFLQIVKEKVYGIVDMERPYPPAKFTT